MEQTLGVKLENIAQVLPVIPTMDVVVFPHMVVPLLVVDEQIIRGIEESLNGTQHVLLLATQERDDGATGPVSTNDLFNIGTIAHVMRVMKLPDGGIKVLVQGLIRTRIERILSDEGTLTAQHTPLPYERSVNHDRIIEARLRNLTSLVETMSSNGRTFGPDAPVILSQMQDPEKIADFILSHLSLSVTQAQTLLEQPTLEGFLDHLYELLRSEIEINRMQEKIQSDARESINRSQREYYLREQLRAIKRELGDDNDAELEELRSRAARLPLSEEAHLEVDRQIKRLEKIPPDSMETAVVRSYLDWILGLPWGTYTTDNLDIKHAQEVLDADHYGLSDIKDRILDFLSVRALKENCHTPIICFVGPPGTGKTSLGHSIAKSMGRCFGRISLGGIHDEAEIRGHRRTYVGAMPGRFIQAIRKAGSCNPVLLIDEIDKVGHDMRGDPSAALLEVLDPEQNSTFHDNYLGVGFDLSKILFIATANDMSGIPAPLRDRMEVIELSGYTLDEKVEIAQRHLIPKAKENFGLDREQLSLPRDVVCEMINGFTRESGVRQLERLVQKLCSKYARHLVAEQRRTTFAIDTLPHYLGPRQISPHGAFNRHRIGVANCLAWTPYGGEVFPVEAVLMPGSGKFILTGQLGEVMKESAQAAVTYAKAHAQHYDIPREFFVDYDLHIHLPAGATPKEGPSAGITLLSAILSVFTMRPVNGDWAMTGEINLQGEVLPIGGLKEKILAAKQEGIFNVIIPRLNAPDLGQIEQYTGDINIVCVDTVAQVLDQVLLARVTPTTDAVMHALQQ